MNVERPMPEELKKEIEGFYKKGEEMAKEFEEKAKEYEEERKAYEFDQSQSQMMKEINKEGGPFNKEFRRGAELMKHLENPPETLPPEINDFIAKQVKKFEEYGFDGQEIVNKLFQTLKDERLEISSDIPNQNPEDLLDALKEKIGKIMVKDALKEDWSRRVELFAEQLYDDEVEEFKKAVASKEESIISELSANYNEKEMNLDKLKSELAKKLTLEYEKFMSTPLVKERIKRRRERTS